MRTNKLLKTGKLSVADHALGTSSSGQDRGGGNIKREKVSEHIFLEGEEIEHGESKTDNETVVVHAKIKDDTLLPDDYRSNSGPRSEEDGRKASREEARANIVVTGGASTFLLLAALLVTATFLMSPVFEQVFGETQDTPFDGLDSSVYISVS